MSDNLKILTIDVEDWFHIEFQNDIGSWNSYKPRIEGNIEKIFELLEMYNQPASFFCLGWIAEKYPQIIKRIDSLGYEIGSHSYDHKLIYTKTPKEFEEDLKKSLFLMEDIIGKKVKLFRAPAFSVNNKIPWFFEILHKHGIEADSSVFPGKRDFGGFPGFAVSKPVIMSYNGITIKEFPMNALNIMGYKLVFSGGGYFRLMPYSLIKRFSMHSDYLVTYFHPRDIDADQPLLQGLSLSRRFKSYVGLQGGYAKLSKLLSDFRFVNLSNAVSKVDWGKADIITL